MIKARLLPASLTQDVVIDTYRQVVREGRSAVAASRRASRSKALRYVKHLRSRGFTKGYLDGLSAARSDIQAAMEDLRNCYHDALSNAQQDIQSLAQQLATQVVDASIVEQPEIFAVWVQKAIAALKRSRTLHLSLNPRYKGVLCTIATHLPEGVSIALDPTAASIDFRLEGDMGGIEFSWREVISMHPQCPESYMERKSIE